MTEEHGKAIKNIIEQFDAIGIHNAVGSEIAVSFYGNPVLWVRIPGLHSLRKTSWDKVREVSGRPVFKRINLHL